MRSTLEGVLTLRRPGTAVPAFTCYELSAAMGVITAVSAAGVPAVVLVSAKAAERDTGLDLIAALRVLVDRAPVPLSLMLDHAKSVELIDRSFTAGVDSVLADGSSLSFADNVSFTQAVMTVARKHAGSVEAELGVIVGDEDRRLGFDPQTDATGPAGAAPGIEGLTDPAAAAEFVLLTGCDALAVAVGNRHGGPPAGGLAWTRLAELETACTVPLVLHGASGLTAEQVGWAVSRGVAKLNFNTQLRRALFGAAAAVVGSDADQLDVERLVQATTEAVADAAAVIVDQVAAPPGTQAVTA